MKHKYTKLSPVILIMLLLSIKTYSQKVIIGKCSLDGLYSKNVNLVLFSAVDSTILSYSNSDSLGLFKIYTSIDDVVLYASHVGYQDIYINFNLIKQETNIDISLKSISLNLSEVEVKAYKPLIKSYNGSIIIDPNHISLKAANNVFGILKRVPGIKVNNSNEIIYRGNLPKYYINGKELKLERKELLSQLKQLTVETIESIELIGNASAEYGADNQVVINIRLKDSLYDNTLFNVYSQYNKHSLYAAEAGISLTKRKGAQYVNSSIGYINEITYQRLDELYKYKNLNIESDVYQESPYKSFSLDTYYSLDINKNNSIDLSIIAKKATNPLSGIATKKLHYSNDEQKTSNSMTSTDKVRSISFNLGYIIKYKKLKTVFELASATHNRPQTQDLEYNFGVEPKKYIGLSQSLKYGIKTISIDNEINKNNIKYKFGAKYNNTSNYANFGNDTVSTKIQKIQKSDNYTFKDGTVAFYGTLTNKIGLFNYVAGARIENTQFKLINSKTNISDSKSYWFLAPSLNVNYNLKNGDNFSFSFSRKIVRPTIWQLNPIPLIIDYYTASVGNDKILPEEKNTIQLNYSKSNTTFSIGNTISKNSITYLPVYNIENNHTNWTPLNYNRNSLYCDLTLFKSIGVWSQNHSLSLSYATENMTNIRQANTSGIFSSYYWQNTISLKKKLDIETTYYIELGSKQSIYSTKTISAINFSLVKEVFSNFKVQLNANDIFYKSNSRFLIQINDAIVVQKAKNPSRYVGIRLSYSIGTNNNLSKRDILLQEDEKRLKR